MPQLLNDCLEWEWEGMGIDHVGMGENGNLKSHSRRRSSLWWGTEKVAFGVQLLYL